MLIRPAQLRDWDAYQAVFESVVAEGKWLGTELPVDWDVRRQGFETSISSKDTLILLAESDDGNVVGWAFSHHQSSGQAVLGMGIIDGHRSAGLGTRLLEAVIGWAREGGAHKVVLEVWPHNTRAIGLYEKLGFVVEGRYRRHWRWRDGSLWDSVMMGLVLDETSPGGPPS
jgi:RimJ/RimL family protein N-acetyltransferase